MRIISFIITQDGEHVGKTPIRDQAISAAKKRAGATGKPVTVTAILDDGRTRDVEYHPDGNIRHIWDIDKSKPLAPEPGAIYRNAGGGVFRCESANGTTAWMTNTKSGWHFQAHGCRRYFDGTIEWDYSTDGRFTE